MSRFDSILWELRKVQSRLKYLANEIWEIKFLLNSAYHRGCTDGDFLPRRLHHREMECGLEFERLVHKLHRIISAHLDSSLFVISSDDDLKTIMSINRTIRYIHNSFAGDPPVGETLSKLKMAFPAYSQN